jgi:hypothetical protein
MGLTITMSANQLFEVDEDSVTPHVVRRSCWVSPRGAECGGAASQPCRNDGQSNDDLD